MDDLIGDFVAEAREGIEALDSELVRFEQSPDNPRLLEEIFRLIHTIKGTCGFIGLVRLQAVAHAAETVLGGFRDGSVAVAPEAVSAILAAVDLIRDLIEGLARNGLELAGDDRALIERLDRAMQAAPESEPVAPAMAAPAAALPLLNRLGGEATLDAACEMTINRLPATDGLEALAELDADRLQGALRSGLCAVARGFGDAGHFAGQVHGLTGSPPAARLIETLLHMIGEDLAALEIAAPDIAELMSMASPVAEAAPEPEPELQPAPEVAAPVSTARRSDSVKSAEPVPSAPVTAEPDASVQTIRVSVDALEHMMTVVSELVLIRNQLLQLLRLEPESPFAAPLHRLNQVTSELQEGVMTTRMQPIHGAWAKLPRLVRDLAADLGKTIELSMKGQETELDRQVLELIRDPLTHMIRNAADHGLETPAERREAGKPETGRITLSARHEGGAIVIEIADDGRGLSAARIRAKAVSCGLISAQQAETMSDAETRQLIFLPGFSTAAAVTAVSGRGVGMDVVRTNIEKIGGVIELSSVEGEGSRFTIQIPLTLTIISALIVECCGERFAMPQSSVVELVSANGGSGRSIEYINGAAVLRLRDRLLPLVSLQGALGLPAEAAREGEACIVVARVAGFSFGVIVDRVFDTEEIVVKPVASVLRHLKVYSGATILGDGAVIMILDFKGMAMEGGAGKLGAAGEDEAAAAASHAETTALLLFRAPDDTLKAAPLSAVSRIEEVATAAIERAGGRSVIQYRGELMPVIGADGESVAPGQDRGALPLLVFARDRGSIGLMVEEVVDIVEAVLPPAKPSADGSLGCMIINDRATELIDVDYYWRRAMREVSAPLAPPAAETDGEPRRRLLVVDRSPFCQLLLLPLLSQAGYTVTVAMDAEAALVLHEAGRNFDLIMTDMSGPDAARFARTFARAVRWHAVPLLGLGLQKAERGAFDGDELLDAVSDSMSTHDHSPMRGAA